MAKAAFWPNTDAEGRKRGERTGLDTLVVHAVNDEYLVLEDFDPFSAVANAISTPPGDYDRKIETQRN